MAKGTKTKTLTIGLLLDRSGSMVSVREETITAVNQYLKETAKGAPKSTVTITTFDSQGFETPVKDKKVGDAELLAKDFEPRAWTPLLDAIAYQVKLLDGTEADHKALVIMTDGYENASKEHTKASIKALLDKRQKDGWLVIYLGANQDAISEGGSFGTQAANTMTFDTANIGQTMGATARSTVAYASTGNAAASGYTAEERKEAVEKSK